jgi:histidinol-phosphate aminotransferase
MVCPPTYDMYSICAKIQHAHILSVPLIDESFDLDIDAILETWQPQCKLIFLCSPNNPTGNVYTAKDILHLCNAFKNKAMVIVDEAYIEFSDKPSMSQYLNNHDNLVVLRTLSKAYGMAGARLGAVMAHPELIALLSKVISPYPLARPIVDVVMHELQDEKLLQMEKQIKIVKDERESLIHFLKQLNYVEKVWESDANFVLLKVNNAEKLMNYCTDHNLIIRDRSNMLNLHNCVRISIGTEDENTHLKTLLERYE